MQSNFKAKFAVAMTVLAFSVVGAHAAAAAPAPRLSAIEAAHAPSTIQVYDGDRGFKGCPGGGLPGDYGARRCYKGYGGSGFYYGPGPYSFGAAGEPYYYGVFSAPDGPASDSACADLRRRAVASGSRRLWNRYRACAD